MQKLNIGSLYEKSEVYQVVDNRDFWLGKAYALVPINEETGLQILCDAEMFLIMEEEEVNA